MIRAKKAERNALLHVNDQSGYATARRLALAVAQDKSQPKPNQGGKPATKLTLPLKRLLKNLESSI